MYRFENIAKVYDLLFTGLSGDKKFYLEEAKKAKGKVLEIGVGTGRIFLELLKNNVDAQGIDISNAMLSLLKENAKKKKLNVLDRVSKQDMRSFKLKDKFDLITIPYRAFLHNETIEDQLAALDKCYKHLKPNGKLILNFFHFNPLIVARQISSKKAGSVRIIQKKNYKLKVHEEASYDFKSQSVDVTYHFEERSKGRPIKKCPRQPHMAD